eukprot:g32592.t1
MNEFYAEGKARAIGVSNYCPSCYDCLESSNPVMTRLPMVNQVQLHLGMGTDPEGFVSYHKAKGIQLQAYSVLGNSMTHHASSEILNGNLTTSIGKAHNKSSVQVALKWVISQGIPAVTKSSSSEHLKEDLDLWSWNLTTQDKQLMDAHRSPKGSPSFACNAAEAVQHLSDVTADLLVIKSRPDVLLPEGLVEHIFQLDFSLPSGLQYADVSLWGFGSGKARSRTLMVAGHQLKNDWSRPNGRPWQVRVVRNIYPSMSVPREYYDDGCDTGFLDDRAGNMINPRVGHPLYLQVPGVGFNDVVIETPLHNMCAALEQEECIALALRAIVIRGQQLLSNPLVGYVTVFKQHKCGSIVHAHWQIITTPFVPSSVDVQLIRAARLKQRFGLCVGCQVLVSAPTGTDLASERLVLETEHFVVSAPFACRERWRLYLAPKRHSPDFFQILPLELED